jgi:DNA repair exonuclease SbcCD ATPase subunit
MLMVEVQDSLTAAMLGTKPAEGLPRADVYLGNTSKTNPRVHAHRRAALYTRILMPAAHTQIATMASNTSHDKSQEHSLNTAGAELKYERSSHLVDIISKDEDLRRLRFDIHILEDDNDEMRELLDQEGLRSEQFERLVSENLGRAEDAEARLADVEDALRAKESELGTLQAEARALQTTAADSEAFLVEKLALTRELSIIRPQLDHLKAQVANTEALMAEKLDLQRQITEVQCELENAKRDVKRAMAKRRNTGVEIAQEEQVEQLRRELAKEKRARQRAEAAADVSQADVNVDEVRRELAREKRARQKAEEELEAVKENNQIEEVRRDLLQEKKARAKLGEQIESLEEELAKEKRKAAKVSDKPPNAAEQPDDQVEELRQELAREKKDRAKAEKAAEKHAAELEAQKATLDEKLGQFRNKLKSTKEKLKETEAELEAAREQAAATTTLPDKKTKKSAAANSKKRSAAPFDADATNLGTPGDGPANKRGRKAAPTVGEKSSFSITPFLNRTASIAPESDNDEAEDGDKSVAEAIATSPTMETAAATRRKKLPLAPVDTNVQKKPAPRQRKQKPTMPMLEMVTEEAEDVHSQGQENSATTKPAANKIKTKTHDGDDPEKPVDAATKKKQKKRKSLVDFETFNKPEAAKKVQSKKNRKLGGLGKTLFDEEEESAAPAKPLAGRTLIGGRAFGGLGAGAKKAGLLGASKLGSSLLLSAQDGSGFQFSPLKRRKANLDDTLRG